MNIFFTGSRVRIKNNLESPDDFAAGTLFCDDDDSKTQDDGDDDNCSLFNVVIDGCDSSHDFVLATDLLAVFVINDARDDDDLTSDDFVSSSDMVAVVLMLLVSALDTLGERSFCRRNTFVCGGGVPLSVCISFSLSLDALDFRGRSVGPMLRTDFRKSLFVHFGLSMGVTLLAGESPFGAGGGNE